MVLSHVQIEIKDKKMKTFYELKDLKGGGPGCPRLKPALLDFMIIIVSIQTSRHSVHITVVFADMFHCPDLGRSVFQHLAISTFPQHPVL